MQVRAAADRFPHLDTNLTNVLAKALDTSTTNGNNLLDPVFLSKIISEQVRTVPTLRNAVTRLPWPGLTYNWDIATDFGAASTAADGATNIATSDAKWSQGNATMSQFYYAAYISNAAIKATEALLDVVSTRIGQATSMVLRKEGDALYNGDSNNASSVGLKAAIAAGPNGGYFASGETADISLFSEMVSYLTATGYAPGAFVVTPGVMKLLSDAAFNKVRFVEQGAGPNIGFPFSGITVCGVPVINDIFAVKYVPVTGETMNTVSGNTAQFTFKNANVQRIAGSNFVGTTWAAPVIKVSGTAKTAGTDYTIDRNGVVTFLAGAPAATPTADYTYGQDAVFALSLNPKDLVIAELEPIMVENDLGKPVNQDAIPFRVKQYSTHAVRDAKAHLVAPSVILPTAANFG